MSIDQNLLIKAAKMYEKSAAEPTWGQFGHEFAQNFNPMNNRPKGTGYANVLDRWYNPFTKQQVTERGEHGLMRAGQAALGTGAAAGALATGIPTAVASTAAPPAAVLGAGYGAVRRAYNAHRNFVNLLSGR